MSMTMAQVEETFNALIRRERAAILQRGIRNLDTRAEELPASQVEGEWRNELSRRINDMRSGEVELLDLDESHRQIRAQRIARRK